MPRRKWPPKDVNRLRELAKGGLDAQAIYDTKEFPGRSVRSIETMLVRLCASQKKFYAAHVKAGEIAELDEITSRYVDAFRQICEQKEFTRDELERFKIIFQAASKYRELFAAYMEVKELDERLAAVEKMVAEIRGESKAQPRN